MYWFLGFIAFLLVATTKFDPLVIIVVVFCAAQLYRSAQIKQSVSSLEYWKAKEFQVKRELQEGKENEKNRRLAVRELRTRRREKTQARSKELRVLDRVFKKEDRAALKLMPLEERRGVYKIFGVKESVMEEWLYLTQGELERRKLGLD